MIRASHGRDVIGVLPEGPVSEHCMSEHHSVMYLKDTRELELGLQGKLSQGRTPTAKWAGQCPLAWMTI